MLDQRGQEVVGQPGGRTDDPEPSGAASASIEQVAILATAEQAVEHVGPVRVAGLQLGAGALGGGAEVGRVVDQQVERQAGRRDVRAPAAIAFRPSSSTSLSR